MGLASFAMFMFPRNLKGNRIPPPEKMRAIEAEKKLEMQQEESAPKFKGTVKVINSHNKKLIISIYKTQTFLKPLNAN